MKQAKVMGLVAMAAIAASPVLAQDAAAGGSIFKTRCQMCHTDVAGKPAMIGPNLSGVVGRKAASSTFTMYSPALKASGLTWAKPTLDKFLTAPGKLVPGTRMVINVADPKDRANLIAYLATRK